MKVNRHWEERDGCYELHFEEYGTDRVVLKFAPDTEDKNQYWYISEDLTVNSDYEFCDSIEDAKETFEDRYEQYIEGQAAYYKELLEQWNEEGENNAD